MGMFDYLFIDGQGDEFDGKEFQTKDTPAQYLETYKIDVNGRLLHEDGEYYVVPVEKRPYYQEYLKRGKAWLLAFGSMSHRNKHWVDTEYHGDLDFIGENGKYKARFTDGQLVWIAKIEP